MRLLTYHRRALSFHWRTNLAVTLGVAVGTAALTGALLVGDSMRGSLREAALGRLGRVDHALVASRFFREELASEILTLSEFPAHVVQVTPTILLAGGASHVSSRARANRISVIGVDESFWELKGEGTGFDPPELTGRTVILNEPLATELGAGPGDEILVRLGKPSDIATETLLGRRDNTTSTLRLTVQSVIPAEDVGAFSLRPRHFFPKNAFIPLATLQRAIDKRGRVNALLVACEDLGATPPAVVCDALQTQLSKQISLVDLGLRLRMDGARGYVALESEAMLIEPAVEAAAVEAAKALGLDVSKSLTYLANSITKEPSSRSPAKASGIPYSTVTAVDGKSPALASLSLADGDPVTTGPSRGLGPARTYPTLEAGEILLNEWAADDLDAKPGDHITLTYYVTGPLGRLESKSTTFVLGGVIALSGAGADPGWTPPYEGVTDTDNLADWDAPFPMDLSAVRDKDEAYWDEHRTTPKAFISLTDGERLWAASSARFGRLTSIRIGAAAGRDLTETAQAFEHALRARINVKQLGLAFEPVRAQMAAASEGTTDFGMLFIGFSFFLIASAAMLVSLLFRLGVERRAAEVGLLLATGFSPRAVTGLLMTEGALLAAVGGAIGLCAALGYAWFILTGLRSWWSQAVHTPFLTLHWSTTSLVIGFAGSALVAMMSIAWSIRGLSRLSARSLLAGAVAAGGPRTSDGPRGAMPKRSAGIPRGAAGALALAVTLVALSVATDAVSQTVAFFVSGTAILVAGLAILAHRLQIQQPGVIYRPGKRALTQLGIRNARRHRGRSILTAGLIASATFLIVALQAFHLDVNGSAGDRNPGTGGFALFAESAVPLLFDLNTRAGREALDIVPAAGDMFDAVTVVPFRLRPGDESSCLSLYRPTRPRILGAPAAGDMNEALIQRGGFRFASTLEFPGVEIINSAGEGGTARPEHDEAVEDNPWLLLSHTFPDGAIPVIGDENAVKWQLHLGLGKDLTITDERGRDVRLRFVALLSGSALQDELIIAESNFVELFPSISGYAFFLIDAPRAAVSSVERTLERELAAFSFDVGSTAARLAEYVAVQNTYLSTFQMLGAFGLVLGTIGLTAVMLRNVWERRGELALMRALGFSRAALGWMVLAENVALLVAGLLTGSVSAMLAIVPHVISRPGTIPWLSLGVTLAAVFATGLAAGVAAIAGTLRAPLLPALRAE